MGHVTVAGLSTNHLVELAVRMQVTAADGSAIDSGELSALVDDLIAAGYTNSLIYS